jgi:transcription factor SPN1
MPGVLGSWVKPASLPTGLTISSAPRGRTVRFRRPFRFRASPSTVRDSTSSGTRPAGSPTPAGTSFSIPFPGNMASRSRTSTPAVSSGRSAEPIRKRPTSLTREGRLSSPRPARPSRTMRTTSSNSSFPTRRSGSGPRRSKTGKGNSSTSSTPRATFWTASSSGSKAGSSAYAGTRSSSARRRRTARSSSSSTRTSSRAGPRASRAGASDGRGILRPQRPRRSARRPGPSGWAGPGGRRYRTYG